MAETFDAYYTWLGIPPEEQPPSLYRLLGVRAFEQNPDVISNAADQRMTHLRGFQNGTHAALSQKLLNEVSTARVTLLNADKKLAYDQKLRSEQEESRTPKPLPPLAQHKPPAAAAPAPLRGVSNPGQPGAATAAGYARPQLAPKPAPAKAGPAAHQPGTPIVATVAASVSAAGNKADKLERKKSIAVVVAAVAGGLSAVALAGGLLAAGFFSRPAEVVVKPPAPPVPKVNPTPPVKVVVPSNPGGPTGPIGTPANVPAVVAQNASRKEWRYGPKREAYFRDLGNNQGWEEKGPGIHFRYVERNRTAECVELYDASRAIGVRLFTDYMQFNRSGGAWYSQYGGEWVASSTSVAGTSGSLENSGVTHVAAESWTLGVLPAIDLLERHDPRQHLFGGDISVATGATGKTWTTLGANFDRVELPCEFPEQFVLEAHFARLKNIDGIHFGIPVGNTRVAVGVDRFATEGNPCSGLELVNFNGLNGANYAYVARGAKLKNDEEVRLHVLVLKNRIYMRLNDTLLTEWSGDPAMLSNPFPGTKVTPRGLTLITRHSSYRISRLRIHPVTSALPSAVSGLASRKLSDFLAGTNSPPQVAVNDPPAGLNNPNVNPPLNPGPDPNPNAAGNGGERPAYLLELDGNSSVRLTGVGGKPLLPADGFTLEMWAKPGELSGRHSLFTAGDMTLMATRLSGTSLEITAGRNSKLSGHVPLNQNGNWFHVSLRQTAEGTASLQVNGVDRGPEKRVLSLSADTVSLGGNLFPIPGDRYWIGQIRGLRISSKPKIVKPAEVFTRDDDTLVLLDFTAASKGKLTDLCGRAEVHLTGSARVVVADPSLVAVATPPKVNITPEIATPPPAQPAGAAIPNDADQKVAKDKLKSAFGDFTKVAKVAEKAELARKFLNISSEETNVASRYVLLAEAREMAVNAGDLALALDIHAALVEGYAVDDMALRQKLLTEFAGKTLSVPQRESLASEMLRLAGSALQAERLEIAEPAATMALGFANRGSDVEQKKQAKALRDEVTAFKNVAGAMAAAQEKLKTNAQDGEANLVVGRFQALVRNQWEKGLAHLALGSDPALAKAAKLDLAAASATEAGPRMAAADAWYDLAVNLKGEEKISVQRRAHAYYSESIPVTAGIEKAKAEQRATELARVVEAADAAAVASGRKPIVDELLPGAVLRLYAGSSGRETPTPFLAAVTSQREIYALNVGSYTFKTHQTYSAKYMLAGRLKLTKDTEVSVSLDNCKCQVGSTWVNPSQFGNTARQTLSLKKGEHVVLITSIASYGVPDFTFTDSLTGQNVLFYAPSDLKRELAKVVPLPSGGSSPGVLMAPRN